MKFDGHVLLIVILAVAWIGYLLTIRTNADPEVRVRPATADDPTPAGVVLVVECGVCHHELAEVATVEEAMAANWAHQIVEHAA